MSLRQMFVVYVVAVILLTWFLIKLADSPTAWVEPVHWTR